MADLMKDDQERLVHELVSVVPEFQPVLSEHVAFYEEPLPHVLFGELTRWLIDLYRKSLGPDAGAVLHRETLDRALDFLEQTLATLKNRRFMS
jgi:hypothetical protein